MLVDVVVFGNLMWLLGCWVCGLNEKCSATKVLNARSKLINPVLEDTTSPNSPAESAHFQTPKEIQDITWIILYTCSTLNWPMCCAGNQCRMHCVAAPGNHFVCYVCLSCLGRVLFWGCGMNLVHVLG